LKEERSVRNLEERLKGWKELQVFLFKNRSKLSNVSKFLSSSGNEFQTVGPA